MSTRIFTRAVCGLAGCAVALAPVALAPSALAWNNVTPIANRHDLGAASIGVADPTPGGQNTGVTQISSTGTGQALGDVRIVLPKSFKYNDTLELDLSLAGGLVDGNGHTIRFASGATPTLTINGYYGEASSKHLHVGVDGTADDQNTEGGNLTPASSSVPPDPRFTVSVVNGPTGKSNRISIKFTSAAPTSYTAGKWMLTLSGLQVDLAPSAADPTALDGRGLLLTASTKSYSASDTGDPFAGSDHRNVAMPALVKRSSAPAKISSTGLSTAVVGGIDVKTVLEESAVGQFGAMNDKGIFKVTLGAKVDVSGAGGGSTCEVSILDQDNPGLGWVTTGTCTSTLTASTLSADISGIPEVDERTPFELRRTGGRLLVRLTYTITGIKAATQDGRAFDKYQVSVDTDSAPGFAGAIIPSSSQTNLQLPSTDPSVAYFPLRSTDGRVAGLTTPASGLSDDDKATEMSIKSATSWPTTETDFVVAASDSPADHISAGALARALGAPLLLTPSTGMDTGIIGASGFITTTRNGGASSGCTIHLVGNLQNAAIGAGTSADGCDTAKVYRGDSVETLTGGATPVAPQSDYTRYKVNKLVNDSIVTAVTDSPVFGGKIGIVMSGQALADGVSALPLVHGVEGIAGRVPIITTPTNGLSSTAVDQLKSLGIAHVLMVGGYQSMTSVVEKSLRARKVWSNASTETTADLKVTRIEGKSRYELARNINEFITRTPVAATTTTPATLGFGWTKTATTGLLGTAPKPLLVTAEKNTWGVLGVTNYYGAGGGTVPPVNLVVPVGMAGVKFINETSAQYLQAADANGLVDDVVGFGHDDVLEIDLIDAARMMIN